MLQGVRAHAYCEFCPDTLSYLDVDLASVRGHRDVADAYLVGLAQANEARVATLDLSLADCYPDEALLLPG